MHKRYQRRDEQGSSKVDEDGVSGDIADTAPKFLRDDGPGCCRRTDQADHGTLQHDSQTAVRQGYQHASDADEESALYGKKP